jgi:hypothetical protein
MSSQSKETSERTFVVSILSNDGSSVFSGVLAASKEAAIDAVMQTKYGDQWQDQAGKVRAKATEWR